MGDRRVQQRVKGAVQQAGVQMFAWERCAAAASLLARQLQQATSACTHLHTHSQHARHGSCSCSGNGGNSNGPSGMRSVLPLFPRSAEAALARTQHRVQQHALQLRNIIREMRDLVLVINDAADTAMDAIVGMPLEAIREDAIFTSEHAIELADLAKGYEMQLVFLTAAIQECLSSLDKSDAGAAGTSQWGAIDRVLSSDEYTTFLAKADAFVYNNNLKRKEDTTPESTASYNNTSGKR